jgi:hypothetical protein
MAETANWDLCNANASPLVEGNGRPVWQIRGLDQLSFAAVSRCRGQIENVCDHGGHGQYGR